MQEPARNITAETQQAKKKKNAARQLTVLRPCREFDDSFGKGRQLVLFPRPLARFAVGPHLELRRDKRLRTRQRITGVAKERRAPARETAKNNRRNFPENSLELLLLLRLSSYRTVNKWLCDREC